MEFRSDRGIIYALRAEIRPRSRATIFPFPRQLGGAFGGDRSSKGPPPALECHPACDARLIGGQRATGDPARGDELDANVEPRDRSPPPGSREDERLPDSTGKRLIATRATHADDDDAQADRTFVSQTEHGGNGLWR